MQVYGLKIGSVGVEFSDRQARDKAITTFTHGSTVTISDYNVRFAPNETPFGTYERDTKEVLVNCYRCSGVFSIETAPKRTYPKKESWEKEYGEAEGHICDGCLAQREHEKKVFEAKQVVASENAA